MPRIVADGIELFYESVGEGTPFVLQAHHHLPWMVYQAPYFSQFYRVITFDRRGTGRSANPERDWQITDCARDVKNLLDALDIDKAIVGGMSFGGTIACQFGLDYPERALALILGHIPPYSWPLADTWIANQIAAIERGGMISGFQPRSYDWQEEGPPSSNPAFADTPAGQYEATLTEFGGGGPSAVARMARALANWDIRPRYPELNRQTVPTLVIVAGHDPHKTIEHAYEWHLEIPGSEFMLMPDDYHRAAFENAVEWNTRVHGFLKRNGL